MVGNAPPPWDIVKRLLVDALSQPIEKRRDFLADACGEDQTLYSEVESLLAHHQEAEDSAFLEGEKSRHAVAETVRISDEPSRDESEDREGHISGSSSAPKHHGAISDEALLEFARKHDILVTTGSAQQVVTLLNSRYEVLEEVGRGGMGLVYRARHRNLGMDVAIKVLNPGGSEDRFLREAQILARIKSPHVVRVHDFDVLDDRVPVLVMEWVEGRDLHQMMLDFGGRVPEEYVLRWMRDVCEGMLTAEAEGIIHRDLKPSNILIDGRNQARVADFGLARKPATADAMSRTGSVLGTAYYMSPEQAEDPRGVDTRADIYSFGATFYHALTGEPPFSGETAFSILFKHKTEPLISPRARFPAMTWRTSGILERCLAKSPADRFQSFSALLRQLESSSPETSPWSTTDDQDFAESFSQYRVRRDAYFKIPRPPGLDDVYEFPDGRRIRILVGDLVEQDVDVIVSSDVDHLLMSGGVAESIRQAAGEQVSRDAQAFAPVRPGRAVATPGGNLPARFVFHGVTMGMSRNRLMLPSPDVISEILASCFYLAETLDVTTIAFPLLGTGAGGFAQNVCLDTLFRFLTRMFGRGITCVREARIVLYRGDAQSTPSYSTGLCPERAPEIQGYSVFQHHQPVVKLGGDFFDYTPSADGRVAIALADAGAGVGSVIRVLQFADELRRLLQTDGDPADVVGHLNAWHLDSYPHRFTSIVLAVLNPHTHEVELVNAGHIAPLIRRSDGRVERCSDESAGLPLGVTPDIEYERQSIVLGRKDLLLLYTKGLSEAMNEQSEIYGVRRIQRVIGAAGAKATTAGQAIAADYEQFIGLRPARDDCTFLIVGRE